MSQFGMQMPGGRAKRSASLSIYTGLLFLAVVALGAATAMMYRAASSVAPNGQPWAFHKDAKSVSLK